MKSYFKFLSRNKAYTAINVLGLALSMMFLILIGAYYWQETHIDRQHSKGDRIFVLGTRLDGINRSGSHWRMGRKLVDAFPEIEQACAVMVQGNSIPKNNGQFTWARIMYTDSTFFSMFDFPLISGTRETVLEDLNSIIISEPFARELFGDEDPIGKPVYIMSKESNPLIVKGVFAPLKNTVFDTKDNHPVSLITRFEHITPINPSLTEETMPNATGAEVFLLAKKGVDLREKREEMQDYMKTCFWIFQMPGCEDILSIYKFHDIYLDGIPSVAGVNCVGNKKMVNLLFYAALGILLFSLMNYVNLTVAQSGFRAKEMALRRLLGEGRTRIALRFICESSMLVLISFIIGLGLAVLAKPYMESLLHNKLDLFGAANVVTISVGAIILIVIGVLAGIIPSMLISSVKPIEVVRGTFRRKSKMLFSKIFIIVQNVVTITMIAACITIYCQTRHLIDAPLGYNTKNIIMIGGLGQLTDRMQPEIEKLSGVEKVGRSLGTPFNRGNNNTFNWEGKTISMQFIYCDKAFLDILGIKPLTDNGNTNGYFVNNTLLETLELDEHSDNFPAGSDSKLPIRGILSDFIVGDIESPQPPLAMKIESHIENPWSLAIKISGDNVEAWNKINDIYQSIVPEASLDEFFTFPFFDQQIADRYSKENQIMEVMTIFTAIAIIISMLGLMAMSTYFVQQRQREIAVRKVLGSSSRGVLIKLIRSFMLYVVIAFVISIPVIYALMTDWLSSYSYRISLSWWIYALAGLFCLIVSFLAVYVQTRIASNANPIKGLMQNQ